MVFIVPPEGAAGSNNVFFEAGVAEGLKKPVVAVVKNPSDIQNIRSVPFCLGPGHVWLDSPGTCDAE
jgi:hypothetical protein